MSSHIFLNFIPRQDRPYYGIMEELARLPDAKVQVIDLPHSLFEVTRKVEYSLRKYIRFIYYGPIYRYLETEVDSAIDAHDGPLFIYTTDEGVWTEFIKQILRKHAVRQPMLVNVQHGLHFLESPSLRSVRLRRVMNSLMQVTLGFPIFGFGLGGSRCDLYLVYGEPECRFLESKGLRAIHAGRIIKAHFLDQMQRATPPGGPERMALFALQPVSREAGFARTEADFYQVLALVARRLARRHGYRVVFRPHPGMVQMATEAALRSAGLLDVGEIQNVAQVDITQALAAADMVLSHSSTVLLEASLAKRKSVQLLEYVSSKRLHLDINFICLETPASAADTDLVATQPRVLGEPEQSAEMRSWVQLLRSEGRIPT